MSFKIGFLSTMDKRGGAAKVAWMLHTSLRKMGFDSRMFVGYKFSDDPNVEVIIDPEKDFKLFNFYFRKGLLYYNFRSSFELVEKDTFKNRDVIHLHNLHGDYFNPFALVKISRLKPVVWTLHDMQALTGRCAYSYDCDKWTRGCGMCPYLDEYPGVKRDASRAMWLHKRKIYERSRFFVVTPSMWLKEMVEASIMGDHPVRVIYNGVDEEIFKPLPRRRLREKVGIPDDAVVLLFIADGGFANLRKGGRYVFELYKYLLRKGKKVVFINLGGNSGFSSGLPNFIELPYVGDDRSLAEVYNISDVLLYPTSADNCPLTIIEAMACGVPAVAFRVGGVPELVIDGENGFLVAPGDVDEFVEKVELLVDSSEKRRSLGERGIEMFKKRFTLSRMVDEYLKLYTAILKSFSSQSLSQAL